MPNLTTVSLTAGIPTTGTGTVSTIDNTIGTAGTPSTNVQTVQGITSMTALKVDGSAVTQPVSAASLPLPSGASTAAKQPALGTAGTASADVISVQGIASMTPLAASQSGTWTVQPGNTANTTAWKVDNTAALDKGSGTGGSATQRVIVDSSQLSSLVTTAQTISAGAQIVTLPTDVSVPAIGFGTTCSTDITRPANTTAYTANYTWADSTSAPTTGGFTLTGAARASGGSGIITDVLIVSSNDPATLLQGEIWIFDSAATAVNDNAAFALSDSDAKKLVGVVPFTLLSTTAGSGTNSYVNVQNLNLGYTCVGTANLRYLVKVKNAYTPASGEVLTVRAKCVQTN